jgi:phospholipid transport system substrate-binding protein
VKIRRYLLLLAPLLLLCGRLNAGTPEAEKRLQSAVNEVLTAAESAPDVAALPAKLSPILLRHISFDAMTRRAVGPGWRQFTNAEKEKAVELFTTLIIRTYSEKITPGEYPVIKFKPASTPAPGRVEVPTILTYRGSTYEVTYRLEEAEGWRITDVMIEGVSLVANYRSQFDALFKKDGANGVLNALTKEKARNK